MWTSSQGIGFLRLSISEVIGLSPDQVTVVHMDGSGCYGHNGADDAALDAVLVALREPGRPVSLRWDRIDEHRHEPLGPAMMVDLAAKVDPAGQIQDWSQDIYTYPHNTRPRPHPKGSRLLASWSLARPFRRPKAEPSRGAETAGHRNAQPGYLLATTSIVEHNVDDGSPLRTSALRSLGATANVYAIESFIDELARASAQDPIELRLRHLQDHRACQVIRTAVSMAGGLQAPGSPDAPGRGLGYARYENSMTYVAVVVELTASAQTGEVLLRRAWIAADAGEIVDPDGLTNQLEGGFIQAASWALYEQVRFDADGVVTDSWDSYPIMRFTQVPTIETRLLDHPDEPPVGAGEASCGPTVAAIANALAQYTGIRLRDLPFSPERLLRAVREST